MIDRTIKKSLIGKFDKGKVIILFGPRQVGKTTLLKEIFKNKKNVLWLNADEPDIKAIFHNANSTRLKTYFGDNKFVIIDEAHTIEDIGLKLKLMVDSIPNKQFIATGSSSFDLRNKTTEPLTGRKWQFFLYPLSFQEMVNDIGLIEEKRMIPHRLVYGYYPEVVLNTNEAKERLKLLTESYLYKDLLMYEGLRMPEKLIHLLKLLASRVGSEVNYNSLSRELKMDNSTVEKYIQILEDSFVIFRLHAFSRNHPKELKKGRKIYFFDNGVINTILDSFKIIENRTDVGALWENYIISELYKKYKYANQWCKFYFWRTQDQQEIDLIIEDDDILRAYEIKWNSKRKVRLSKSFSNKYANYTFNVITPENCEDFLLTETTSND